MLHSSDPTKNHKSEIGTDDYKTDNDSIGYSTFYPKDKLSEDGFIFPDGSLRIEFYVKKNNYM